MPRKIEFYLTDSAHMGYVTRDIPLDEVKRDLLAEIRYIKTVLKAQKKFIKEYKRAND